MNHHYLQKARRSSGLLYCRYKTMAKPFAKKFYSSKAWQNCRNEYAQRRAFLCEDCLRRGIYRPGEIVHHKIEIDPVTIERPEIALNFDNLELLCRDCHARRHDLQGGRWAKVNAARRKAKQDRQRYRIDEYGRVIAKDRTESGADPKEKNKKFSDNIPPMY